MADNYFETSSFITFINREGTFRPVPEAEGAHKLVLYFGMPRNDDRPPAELKEELKRQLERRLAHHMNQRGGFELDVADKELNGQPAFEATILVPPGYAPQFGLRMAYDEILNAAERAKGLPPRY